MCLFPRSVIQIEHSPDDRMTHLGLTATQCFLNIGTGIVVTSTLDLVVLSFHKHFLQQPVWGTLDMAPPWILPYGMFQKVLWGKQEYEN